MINSSAQHRPNHSGYVRPKRQCHSAHAYRFGGQLMPNPDRQRHRSYALPGYRHVHFFMDYEADKRSRDDVMIPTSCRSMRKCGEGVARSLSGDTGRMASHGRGDGSDCRRRRLELAGRSLDQGALAIGPRRVEQAQGRVSRARIGYDRDQRGVVRSAVAELRHAPAGEQAAAARRVGRAPDRPPRVSPDPRCEIR